MLKIFLEEEKTAGTQEQETNLRAKWLIKRSDSCRYKQRSGHGHFGLDK